MQEEELFCIAYPYVSGPPQSFLLVAELRLLDGTLEERAGEMREIML